LENLLRLELHLGPDPWWGPHFQPSDVFPPWGAETSPGGLAAWGDVASVRRVRRVAAGIAARHESPGRRFDWNLPAFFWVLESTLGREAELGRNADDQKRLLAPPSRCFFMVTLLRRGGGWGWRSARHVGEGPRHTGDTYVWSSSAFRSAFRSRNRHRFGLTYSLRSPREEACASRRGQGEALSQKKSTMRTNFGTAPRDNCFLNVSRL